MDNSTNINHDRLNYALSLLDLDHKGLVDELNRIRTKPKKEARKRPYTIEEIFTNPIKISTLKKIDDILDMGMLFYVDDESIKKDKKNSVFFRKTQFNSTINLEDRRILKKVESNKRHLDSLLYMSELNPGFKSLPQNFSTSDNPKEAAKKIRELIYPKHKVDSDKKFLAEIINTLGDYNIFVYEHIEGSRKDEKTSWNGSYISPNTILLNRKLPQDQEWEGSYKKEIFTLAHELGHYLLGSEDIDRIDFSSKAEIEIWCNNFAFDFLVESDERLRNIPKHEIGINNEVIKDISKKSHISRLAIFFHLKKLGKINKTEYQNFKTELDNDYRRNKKNQDDDIAKATAEGKKIFISTSPRIISSYEEKIYAFAFWRGIIDEHSVRRATNRSDVDELVEKYLS